MSSNFLNDSSITVSYPDVDILSTIPIIATQNIVAFNDIDNVPQNLNLGATSNMNIQALSDINIKHGSSDKLLIGNSNSYLSVNFADRVILSDVTNSGLTLTSTDTIIGTTHLTEQSNFLKLASALNYGIDIDNNLAVNSNLGVSGNTYLQSNLDVQGDTNIFGKLTTQGKFLANEIAIYSGNPSTTNANQVGYSWMIDENDRLELVKYTYFNDDSVVSKKVATFGFNNMNQGDNNDIYYMPNALRQTGILNPTPIESMLGLTKGPYSKNTIYNIRFTSSRQSTVFRLRDYLTDTASINYPYGCDIIYSILIFSPGLSANAVINQSNNVEMQDDGSGSGSTYSITITANNGIGTASQTFTVTNYSPLSILPNVTSGNLALWLDASYSSSVIMSGNNVTGWIDQSTNAISFSQATFAYQPTLTASALKSRAGIYFDGNKYMSTSSYTAANLGENNTLFFVLSRYAGGLVMFKGYSDQNYSTPSVKKIWMGDSTTAETARGGYPSFVGNGSDYSIANTNASLTYTVVCMQTTSANNINMYINGTLISNNNYYLDLITDQANFMTIGGCINPSAMSSTNFVGYIHEILHYNASLNSTDITAVNSYLTNKWI